MLLLLFFVALGRNRTAVHIFNEQSEYKNVGLRLNKAKEKRFLPTKSKICIPRVKYCRKPHVVANNKPQNLFVSEQEEITAKKQHKTTKTVDILQKL